MQENSATVAEYTYDEVGNRKRIDLGNGTYTTYNHAPDPRYFVSEIDHYYPTDQLLGAIVYSDRDQSRETGTGTDIYNLFTDLTP